MLECKISAQLEQFYPWPPFRPIPPYPSLPCLSLENLFSKFIELTHPIRVMYARKRKVASFQMPLNLDLEYLTNKKPSSCSSSASCASLKAIHTVWFFSTATKENLITPELHKISLIWKKYLKDLWLLFF